MRLDFNVLWVDDQQAAVGAQRDSLERRLRDEGFRLFVDFAGSVAEAGEKLADDVFKDNIDLILMDYDLGVGPDGAAGLKEARSKLPYREIVFYSSQRTADLLRLVAEAKVEGVYCSTREDLPERAHGVFETLVKKVLDIDHCRGIVMGATSDIDHVVNSCLLTVFEAGDDKLKADALGHVQVRLKEIRARFEKTAAEIEAVSHLKEIYDKHAVYTSVDRLNLLRKLIKGELHTTHGARMKTYANDVVKRRNDLAHLKLEITAHSRARRLLDRSGKEFTTEEMRQLRKDLLEHQENFEGLVAALLAGGEKPEKAQGEPKPAQ